MDGTYLLDLVKQTAHELSLETHRHPCQAYIFLDGICQSFRFISNNKKRTTSLYLKTFFGFFFFSRQPGLSRYALFAIHIALMTARIFRCAASRA